MESTNGMTFCCFFERLIEASPSLGVLRGVRCLLWLAPEVSGKAGGTGKLGCATFILNSQFIWMHRTLRVPVSHHSPIPYSRNYGSATQSLCQCFFFFFSRKNYIAFIYLFFYCSGFCHTLKWNSHGFTCVPHPDPPSHLPPHPLPLGLPSVPGPSTCLMHPTWAGDLFHPRQYTCFDAVLLKHSTLAFSHRV